MTGETYGERWHGFAAAPRPPRHIETAMETAGRNHDNTALDLAHAAYTTWLTEHGYTTATQGTRRPDKANQ